MLGKMLEAVRRSGPLVHCITNYVTVNDCANILLACGGSPIMADDAAEAEDITSICSALDINIGTLNERTVKSMILAGRRANKLCHPVLLDPVGAGASALRNSTAAMLLDKVKFSVIRGNISEIKAVQAGSGTTKGVDADVADAVTDDNLAAAAAFARALSEKTGAVIVITGAIDIVADAGAAYAVRNGHPRMSKVSGTGCMLSAVICAFVAANPENVTMAALAAVCSIGICGEIAAKTAGNASMRIGLIDAMSMLEPTQLDRLAKWEEIK